MGGKSPFVQAFREWLCRAIIHAEPRIEGLGMRRRILMMVLAGAAVYRLLAGAQQKAIPVIGYLSVGFRRRPTTSLDVWLPFGEASSKPAMSKKETL